MAVPDYTNDFGNRFPYIDCETKMIPAQTNSQNLEAMRYEICETSYLQIIAADSLDVLDHERAWQIIHELLKRNYEDETAHLMLFRFFNELGLTHKLSKSVQVQLRDLMAN